MPNTPSAKKALRASEKKREFNLIKKIKIKNSIKEFRKVLETNPNDYKVTLSKAFSAIDKAAKVNLWHKNKADRKKSRLAALAKKINTAQTN